MSSDSTVSTLSDADVELLALIGRAITQDAVGLIWETVFLSAYGVFFWIAVYSIFRKGLKTRASFMMLAVVIYLYASSLTLWGLNVTWWFKRARGLLMGPSASLVERSNADASDLLLLGTPMESLFMFNMIVGDSVVIWRVWVLYPKKRWVVAIPCLVLLMSFIFTIIDITCLTGAGWSDRSAVAAGGELCSRSELLAWAFSLVTNASCTVLIGIKAWHHRKKMRALSGQRTTTERMLSLLVESGFIYCLFWLTQLVLFFDIPRSSPLIYVYFLFSGMGDQISGMYPTLIIVIVNLHRTVWEPPSTAGGTTSTIRLSTGRPTISTGTTQGDFDSGFELELGKSRNAV